MTLTLLMNTGQLFLENVSRFQFVYYFLIIRLGLCTFGRTTTEVMGLSESLMSTYLIAGGITFGHLVKVVSSGSLHYKVSIFSFVSVTFLVGRDFEITHIMFLTFATDFTTILFALW